MADNYFIPLFKENDRTNVVVYRSVKFSKILVGVSRCPHCQKIHQDSTLHARIYAWGLAVILSVISIIVSLKIDSILGTIGIVLVPMLFLILIGLLGSTLLENVLAKQKGILTKKDGVKRYEIIRAFLSDGWSFNPPTA